MLNIRIEDGASIKYPFGNVLLNLFCINVDFVLFGFDTIFECIYLIHYIYLISIVGNTVLYIIHLELSAVRTHGAQSETAQLFILLKV